MDGFKSLTRPNLTMGWAWISLILVRVRAQISQPELNLGWAWEDLRATRPNLNCFFFFFEKKKKKTKPEQRMPDSFCYCITVGRPVRVCLSLILIYFHLFCSCLLTLLLPGEHRPTERRPPIQLVCSILLIDVESPQGRMMSTLGF